MDEKLHIIPHQHPVTAIDRCRQNGHQALVVWFTGLSGSGKSTIASRLEQLLMAEGVHTYILDGDNVRVGLNKGLSFSPEDRRENLRRIAEVGKLFVDAGIVVLSAFVSPLKKDREMIKNIVGASAFVEVFVNTSLEECERRDVKGLYQKARNGEISNFTGLSAPYEAPDQADVEIKTEGQSVDDSAQQILAYLLNSRKIKSI